MIKKYFKKLLLNPEFLLHSQTYKKKAEADAAHCYLSISPYLKKNKKILEVGGGGSSAYQFFTSRL